MNTGRSLPGTRRQFLRTAGTSLLLLGMTRKSRAFRQARARMYIGTYTSGENTSRGIYQAGMDVSNGELELVGLAAEAANPSYLTIGSEGKRLFSVHEVSDYEGERQGYLSSFRIDPETGTLAETGRQPTVGSGPCYVDLDPSGKTVLVANYGGGSVVSYPVRDGAVGARAGFSQHEGSSVDPGRQKGPHAHCIVVDPSGRFALSADLGLDQILVYRLDTESGSIAPNDPALVSLAPGAGPRHLVFGPAGRMVYAINELNSTVSVLSFDAENGTLEAVQTIGTLPDDAEGTNYPADIHLHPSGRFLYGSNRGHDSIAVYRRDPSTGLLTWVDSVSTGGAWPRNFVLSPDGRFLFVANQNGHSIVGFSIDLETGIPAPTGQALALGSPVCLKFSIS